MAKPGDDRTPLKACPSCQARNHPSSGAQLHCKSASSNCTWIVCPCGRTYDIFTGKHIATYIPKAPNA